MINDLRKRNPKEKISLAGYKPSDSRIVVRDSSAMTSRRYFQINILMPSAMSSRGSRATRQMAIRRCFTQDLVRHLTGLV